ncbi:MAG: hypothetical protein U0800_18910 [Isosphaeraceae bacterium]
MLDGRGAILDTARELTVAFRARGISAAVIGGVAVFLHGHARTTRDIDLIAGSDLEEIAQALISLGFVHDPARREFVRDEIPVHLVTADQAGMALSRTTEIEGIDTIPLGDLIAMKLRSGTANMLRAQDLADVIGLIRRHRLTGAFAARLDKTLRPAFRKLARAIEREG